MRFRTLILAGASLALLASWHHELSAQSSGFFFRTTPQTIGPQTGGTPGGEDNGNEQPAQPLAIAVSGLPAGPRTIGESLSATVTATGGAPPYTFSLASGTLAPLLALSPSGNLSGPLTQPGAFSAVVQVADNAGATRTATIAFDVLDLPPAVGNAAVTAVQSGVPVSIVVPNIGSTPVATWTLLSAPGWLSIGAQTGAAVTLAGTPPLGTPSFAFTLRATDAYGRSATGASQTVAVFEALALSLDGLPETPQMVGGTILASLQASGGAPPYSFALASGALPPTVTLGADGSLSGSLTQAGTFAGVLRVTDALGGEATTPFSVTVQAPAPTAWTQPQLVEQFLDGAWEAVASGELEACNGTGNGTVGFSTLFDRMGRISYATPVTATGVVLLAATPFTNSGSLLIEAETSPGSDAWSVVGSIGPGGLVETGGFDTFETYTVAFSSAVTTTRFRVRPSDIFEASAFISEFRLINNGSSPTC